MRSSPAGHRRLGWANREVHINDRQLTIARTQLENMRKGQMLPLARLARRIYDSKRGR